MKVHRVLWALAWVGASLVRCVGDDSVTPKDSGSDALDDATLPDASDANADALPPPPTPDGSLAWFQHFNTSYTFEDLAVNENSGPSFVVAGGFATPDGGGMVNMGTQQIGPSTGLADDLLATLNASGVVWAITQQPAPVFVTDAGGCAAPTVNVDWFSSVAVDSNGIVYVAGSTSSNIFLLKDEFNGPKSFVAAFSATGTPLWEHFYTVDGNVVNGVTDTFGTDDLTNHPPGKMQLAVSGNKLFVSFGFSGSLAFEGDGGGPIASQGGSEDVFVGALDTSNGSTLWHTTFGSTNDDSVEQIVPTSNGDVLLVGTMNGTMTGPTGTGFPLSIIGDGGGGSDAYLVKLDGSGNAVYAMAFGDTGASNTNGASVSYANGLVAVSGYFFGTVDFGKGSVTAQAGVDGFLVVLDDATRKASYVATLAGSGDDYIRGVALDAWGDALVVGMYGNGNIGGSSSQLGASTVFPQTVQSVNAMVVAKLSPTGSVLWSHALMPTGPDGGAVDPSVNVAILDGVRARATNAGQLVVAGGMNNGADFGKGYQPLLSSTGVTDFCHLRLLRRLQLPLQRAHRRRVRRRVAALTALLGRGVAGVQAARAVASGCGCAAAHPVSVLAHRLAGRVLTATRLQVAPETGRRRARARGARRRARGSEAAGQGECGGDRNPTSHPQTLPQGASFAK